MTDKPANRDSRKPQPNAAKPRAPQAHAVKLPAPVDVVDGIPDREAKLARWKYIALAAVFVAWMAFLIYCRFAARD